MSAESRPAIVRLMYAGVAMALLGAVGSVLGYARDAAVLRQSYLFAFVFWWCLSMGCLGFTLLHHSIKARWSLPVLRFFEAGSALLPVMVLLFLPIIVWLPELFAWAGPEAAEDTVIRFKQPYLNTARFLVSAVVYFVIWIGLAWSLNRSSAQQDRSGDVRLAQSRANLGAAGLVLYVLTVTFAVTDWVMSLDSHWYSTVFGLMFVAGQGYAAVAFVTVMLGVFGGHKPLSEEITPRLTRDLGNMLLTLTMFWAYLALSQYLIMYSANLPEEITYYTTRLKGPWWGIGTWLVVFQFFLPFLLLLSGRTKRTPALLVSVAAWILAMRVLDVFWIVTPFFHAESGTIPAHAFWTALAVWLGMGGIWLVFYALRLSRYPIVARHGTAAEEVLQHG